MIALDPKTTALVLIDLQNGILGRKLAPISADELVARGKALAEKFRAAHAPVVLVNAAPKLDGPERQVDEPYAVAQDAARRLHRSCARPCRARRHSRSPSRPGARSSAPTSMPN